MSMSEGVPPVAGDGDLPDPEPEEETWVWSYAKDCDESAIDASIARQRKILEAEEEAQHRKDMFIAADQSTTEEIKAKTDLLQKLDGWLAKDVGIGGAAPRGFDISEIAQFAWRMQFEDLRCDEIYRKFVEMQEEEIRRRSAQALGLENLELGALRNTAAMLLEATAVKFGWLWVEEGQGRRRRDRFVRRWCLLYRQSDYEQVLLVYAREDGEAPIGWQKLTVDTFEIDSAATADILSEGKKSKHLIHVFCVKIQSTDPYAAQSSVPARGGKANNGAFTVSLHLAPETAEERKQWCEAIMHTGGGGDGGREQVKEREQAKQREEEERCRYVWSWANDANDGSTAGAQNLWVAYPAAVCVQLETALARGESRLEIGLHGEWFVDLSEHPEVYRQRVTKTPQRW